VRDISNISLLDVSVCWRSKSQKGVTLSSTEAEYVAISEAVNELKFVYYLPRDLHIKVKIPIVIKTDNISAIFMSENASTGVRTRHVDTRYHFVREFIEDVLLKLNLFGPLRMTRTFSQRMSVMICM
jgi:hypothetical protein